DTNFSDLISTYTSKADVGLNGVSAALSYNNDAQGTISSTNSTLDLAINGNGYFAVRTATTDATGATVFGTDTFYTRCGDFSTDANGYMVNSEGYYLCGWTVDPVTGVANTAALAPMQILSDAINAPIASTVLTYEANVPAGNAGTTSSATASVYDSEGERHNVSYSWTLLDAEDNRWTLNITAEDGLGTGVDYTSSAEVTFDETGHLELITPAAGLTSADTSISFALSYAGATAQTLTCDLANVTQFATTSISVDAFTANGVPEGSYSSTAIDKYGNVNISFTNGQVERYYQIPVATFVAVDYLAPISGTAYQATLASGAATYSAAGEDGAGVIASSALEESTVDIASEFTNLIKSQQVYSANAKVVTAVNEMMKTLVALQ
ncbi:MAG: flagellar hook-basal body complex protein, partial [Bdellovibrionales bacterium]